MCGILFAYEKSKRSDFISRGIKSLNSLKHRGPDCQKIETDECWQIGQTRLAIVDLSNSNQPMSSPDKRFILTFNGEIYNFRELRSGLVDSWNFRSNGDTEVILAGLVLYGAEFIEKLDGMWAFVFWDKKKKSVIASRDRLGKKPIYYINNTSNMYIASELPALKLLMPTCPKPNQASAINYLKYGYTNPGDTMLLGIKEIKPAHTLTWQVGNEESLSQYWALKEHRIRKQTKNSEEELKHILNQSVKKRLIADVDIGCFLSGGVDSSIIASIASKNYNNQLKTFTIGFTDSGFDESMHAKVLADSICSKHHEYVINEPTQSSIAKLLKNNLGQPFGDPSILPTALLCKEASKTVKVALSGDGADEVFSGYQRYQAKVIAAWYNALPVPIKRNTKKLLALLPDSFSHHSKSLVKKAKLFTELAHSDEFNNHYQAPIIISDQTMADLGFDQAQPITQNETRIQNLESMMYQDMLHYLPQDILTKVDRASMAYSLEVRSPFLDKDLIEFAFQLDLKALRSAFSGKKILKDLYRDEIPKAILQRRKQGFSSPIYRWFLGETGDEMISLAEKAGTPLKPKSLLSMLEKHREGKVDHSLQFWNIYTYLKWLEQTNESTN
jgi:asparagine synthase (glutamine-hydrolysing)